MMRVREWHAHLQNSFTLNKKKQLHPQPRWMCGACVRMCMSIWFGQTNKCCLLPPRENVNRCFANWEISHDFFQRNFLFILCTYSYKPRESAPLFLLGHIDMCVLWRERQRDVRTKHLVEGLWTFWWEASNSFKHKLSRLADV